MRYIFNSVDQGLTYDTIRAHLQSQGVKTTTGKNTFSNGQLNFMLTNPAYKGVKCYCSPKSLKKRGRVTLLTHDPIYSETLPKIIEPALFDRVQRILAERRSGSREGLGLDGKYVLKQTLFCSCGRAMQGMSKKNRLDKPTVYYHCPDHKKGDNPYCAVKDVNKKYVEHAVFSLTDAALNSPAVKAQVTAKLQSKAAELKRAVQKAQDAVNEETEKQLNLVKQLAKGWGAETDAMIEGQIKQVIDEKKRLASVLNSLHGKLQELENLRSAPVPIQKTASFAGAERRKVVGLLVENATADNEKVTVRLRT